MPYEDFFGYFPRRDRLDFLLAFVEPLPDVDAAEHWMEKYGNVDGYLYPDQTHTRRSLEGGTIWHKVPKSYRPTLLHRLPASHRVVIDNQPANVHQARYGLAGFLIHFLGFLQGFRLHFYDWWIDGRVPLKSTADYHAPRSTEVVRCVDAAVDTWNSLSQRQKMVILNALFLHSRTPMHAFEWERFQAEYQVFDAIYAVARDTGRVPRVPHKKRIEAMCQSFSIPADNARTAIIVRLRNDLQHEALWDGRMPGEARSEDSFYASLWLSKFTRRAALALLGIHGPYVRSSWWGLGTDSLQLD